MAFPAPGSRVAWTDQPLSPIYCTLTYYVAKRSQSAEQTSLSRSPLTVNYENCAESKQGIGHQRVGAGAGPDGAERARLGGQGSARTGGPGIAHPAPPRHREYLRKTQCVDRPRGRGLRAGPPRGGSCGRPGDLGGARGTGSRRWPFVGGLGRPTAGGGWAGSSLSRRRVVG